MITENPVKSRSKCEFAIMARDLRVARRLKQRQVAEAIGVKPSTYGNMESSPYKIVRKERVIDLSRFYKLDGPAHEALIAAYDAAPISEYSAKQREKWSARNAMRSKSKAADRYLTGLVDVLEGIVNRIADAATYETPIAPMVCDCQPVSFEWPAGWCCDLCRGFHALGYPDGWVSVEVAWKRLAELIPLGANERPVVLNVPHIPAPAVRP